MRVVTTCGPGHLQSYAHRWLEGRKNWPKDTEFIFYTEGFSVHGCPSKDFADLKSFSDWKASLKGYIPPNWEWDVVRYSHKVFAAYDALYDYKGIGVWLDADCVTYREIPEGLIESQVKDHYLACYQRGAVHTETGLWIMDCSHEKHQLFLDTWRAWYLANEFKKLPMFTDCHTLDATIVQTGVKVNNLSGDRSDHPHPQAVTELGKYIDHAKGMRKRTGISSENIYRKTLEVA
jgi:hypothetical protein